MRGSLNKEKCSKSVFLLRVWISDRVSAIYQLDRIKEGHIEDPWGQGDAKIKREKNASK